MVLDPRTLRAKSTAFIREALANCGVVSESVIRAMEEDDRAAVRRMAERLKKAPRGPRTDMMIHEQQCWQSGSVRVAGVDEAGTRKGMRMFAKFLWSEDAWFVR